MEANAPIRIRKAAITAAVLFSVSAVAVYVYTPWHIHSRFALKSCPLTGIEHGAWSDPAAFEPAIEPLAGVEWLGAAGDAVLLLWCDLSRPASRAPPA